MRMFNIFLMFLLLNCWCSNATEISCEDVSTTDISTVCLMDRTTIIESRDVTISERNENIVFILFSGNNNISFLPYRVYQMLPNLEHYTASHCCVGEISKENFEHLDKLELLHLDDNSIERIESNTFDDLVNIREIHLNYNRIKFMNGKLFAGKPRLNFVDLKNNVCISPRIHLRIRTLETEVSEKCGFDEDA